ncbi:MAG: type II toxin-antitoxin system Phd/YefM family antitoxin [Candidatus Nanopelagicales bacterium]
MSAQPDDPQQKCEPRDLAITVGQLRQNPTQMLREVRAGAVYIITDHGEPIAQVVPLKKAHRGVPSEVVSALLAKLGPDDNWARELEEDRKHYVMRDPWEQVP